jgi:hypothetical protein
VERKEDRFSWPLISERIKHWDTSVEIEPTEQDQIDFEFAVHANVTDVRIYSYIRNEKKRETGWPLSSYYKLDSEKGAINETMATFGSVPYARVSGVPTGV